MGSYKSGAWWQASNGQGEMVREVWEEGRYDRHGRCIRYCRYVKRAGGKVLR
jgi:hypothetical protein